MQKEQSEIAQWKGDALIRSNFNVEPENLQISEWNKMYAQAFWLEEFRLKNQAELFKAMFSS